MLLCLMRVYACKYAKLHSLEAETPEDIDFFDFFLFMEAS